MFGCFTIGVSAQRLFMEAIVLHGVKATEIIGDAQRGIAMPNICYVPKVFRASSMAIIDQANAIIEDYAAQGFDLTLRQLYYQFVARDIIPNRDSEYKRIGSIINDARLAGLIDWDAIQDRTRELKSNAHWRSPESIIEAVMLSYQRDHWEGQPYRPEVWIEKDALIGVITPICKELDVPRFSCRGYTSQSEMWVGGRRMGKWAQQDNKQIPVVLHLGDHDPSGIDMTRDITDRLTMFSGGVAVKRLALNMDQIDEYHPPPNPAKMTDSRFIGYTKLYGNESWELDALEPQVMADLIEHAILALRDNDTYNLVLAREKQEKERLRAVSDNWEDVVAFIEELG